MTLELKIGGNTMPQMQHETPYDMEYLGFGIQFRTLDAALKTQLFGRKWRARIYWNGLSLAERAVVLNAFVSLLSTPNTVEFPDSQTVTVQSILGSWSESIWYSPWTRVGYYNVSFQIEES